MGPLVWTSLADAPDLVEVAHSIEADLPPFLAELTERARRGLDRAAPHLQWVVTEGETGGDAPLPVALVRGVALRWSGAGDDAPAGGAGEALDRSGAALGEGGGAEPDADTLAVLDVTVAFGARGRGVGRAILDGLDAQRHAAGFTRLLLLTRSHAKAAYPLVPFARYASFVGDDGRPFDPWFRAAWGAGFVPVAGVDRSLVASAELAAWRRWLDRPIPGSGPYLVDGAIKPAIIEVERGEGRYREPHLWMARRDALAAGGGDVAHDVAPGDGHTAPDDGPGAGAGDVHGAGWSAALRSAGVLAGDRAHREVRRAR